MPELNDFNMNFARREASLGLGRVQKLKFWIDGPIMSVLKSVLLIEVLIKAIVVRKKLLVLIKKLFQSLVFEEQKFPRASN